MLALRSERVMIFAGPCSPKFTADTLVVSVNVGEGGPALGEALRFPCELVVIVKGRRGRDFGIEKRGFGLVVVAAKGKKVKRGWAYEPFGGNCASLPSRRYASHRVWLGAAKCSWMST